jgi:ketosteroid isomerase-like protein
MRKDRSQKPRVKSAEIPHGQVLKASLSGAINEITELFADDAILLPPNDTTLYGKDEIRSWWEEYFNFFRVTSSVERERELTLDGDQAFERTAFSVTIVPKQGGPKIVDDIRSLIVWRLIGT